MADTCRCRAYPWPHRLGGGRCENESLDAPFCEDCYNHCTPIRVDMGNGVTEAFGSVTNHVDWQWVSDCCEAPLHVAQYDLSSTYIVDEENCDES